MMPAPDDRPEKLRLLVHPVQEPATCSPGPLPASSSCSSRCVSISGGVAYRSFSTGVQLPRNDSILFSECWTTAFGSAV